MDVSKLASPPPAHPPERIAVVVIHGLGRAEPGWINDELVDYVSGSGAGFAFNRFSEVYRLPEASPSGPDSREWPAPESSQIAIRKRSYFLSVARTARLPDTSVVTFVELHWADLSRASKYALVRLFALLRLLFEAPNILAAALMEHRRGCVYSAIRRLILAAIWLLRWPIAGLHVAIFGSAAGYAVLSKILIAFGSSRLDQPDVLPLLISCLLAAIAVAGILGTRSRAVNAAGLTSLFEASAVCSMLLIAGILLLKYVVPMLTIQHFVFYGLEKIQAVGRMSEVFETDLAFSPADAGRVSTYLAAGGWIIIAVWFVWSVLMFLAYALILAILIWRQLVPAARPALPLGRLSAAAGLAVIQSIAWKLIICPASLILIVLLVEKAGRHKGSSVDDWSVDGHFGVNDILVRMVIILVLNMIASAILVAAALVISRRRTTICGAHREALLKGQMALPRLIINPVFLFALLAINVATTTLYYAYCKSDGELFRYLEAWLSGDNFLHRNMFEGARFVVAGGILSTVLTLIGPILASAKSSSDDFVQFFRGAVDHHYTPRKPWHWLTFWRKSDKPEPAFPRRQRLQERLHLLISEVVVPRSCDRLVFLTHSQGTVILNEYLRSAGGDPLLRDIARIDVVTLASPLTHIYEYYFNDPAAAKPSACDISPKLVSWTNLWRIDDPLGQAVHTVAHNFIQNWPIEPGGHTDYWREKTVQDVIIALTAKPKPAAHGFVT